MLMMKMWVKILEKYLPDAELLYNAYEDDYDISIRKWEFTEVDV